MTQKETLALWEACETARNDALARVRSRSKAHAAATAVWNAWAHPLVQQRKGLESRGEWSAWPALSGRLVGLNSKTIAFLAAAEVVFSTSDEPFTFPDDAILVGWVFPGRVQFNSAVFTAMADFNGVVFTHAVEFREAQFAGTASFDKTAFLADCSFSGGEFAQASFHGARFAGGANLAATFGNDADFGLAQFESYAEFGKSRFARVADFDGAAVGGDANFSDVHFASTAHFRQVSFSGYTSFARSVFGGGADFQAAKAERAFTLEGARFAEVPDLIQAHFSEAPRLDNAYFAGGIPRPRLWWRKKPQTRVPRSQDAAQNPNVPAPALGRDEAGASMSARFRALKRLAVAGHDTERELEFNAGEVLSRRGVEDRPFGRNAARFWLGWLYQQSSDFGRSIVMPIRLWILLMILFAVIYLSPWSGRDVAPENVFSCVPVPNRILNTPTMMNLSTNAVWEAVQLSFRNGAFVFGSADPNVEWRALGCLYGSAEDHPNFRRMPRPAAAAAALQRTLSTTLIVLFGMALRNMLKVK